MEDLTARSRGREEVQKESSFLPFFFGMEKGTTKNLPTKTKQKIELFEKTLSNQLSQADTLDEAFEKIVKVALAAEFGPSIIHAKGSQKMVNTITRGIRDDQGLRRHALALICRYSKNLCKQK